MKILLVTQLPPPTGGIAAWSQAYLSYMEKTGHQISVVNTAAIGGRSQNVNASKSLGTELRRCLKIWSDFRKAVRRESFDMVHFNVVGSKTGMIRDLVTMSLLKRSVPRVVEFHSNLGYMVGSSGLGRKLLRAIVRRADLTLVLNSGTADYLQQVTGVKPRCVSNFVRPELVRKEDKVIRPQLQDVIFTGHIVEAKGIREILDAARACPRITFHLMGKGSEAWENCPKNVIFEGEHPQSQVLEALDRADAFLFPSYTEGFSVSLTEAMARGLPVIASNVGANTDMLEDKGGILVEARNADQIVEALKCLEDPAVRQGMSRWNCGKVRNFYTTDVVFEALLKTYHQVMEDRQNG